MLVLRDPDGTAGDTERMAIEQATTVLASALALSVHRSTLKYRLRRIREVSGHDIGHPDVQFNLQVATRAWRTLQALHLS